MLPIVTSWWTAAALGAIAGGTVLLSVPVARLGKPSPKMLSAAIGVSIGVLLFVLLDVFRNATDQVDQAFANSGPGIAYALLLIGGFVVGLFGLHVAHDGIHKRVAGILPDGPGSTLATDANKFWFAVRSLSPAQTTSLFIAIGIGTHNLAEGLAIGQSAASGATRLFLLLVIAFALHNATEGFGIAGPIVGSRPSWGFLVALGLIGGGPTLLGSVIGYQFASPLVSVLVLGLAAGAILHVVLELEGVCHKLGARDWALIGLAGGFTAGFGTDLTLKLLGA